MVLAACIAAWLQQDEIERLRQEVRRLRQDQEEQNRHYEERIRRLEDELEMLQLRVEEPPPPPPPPPPQESPTIFNPKITAFGNVVAEVSRRVIRDAEGERRDNRFWAREMELDMRASVDPFAEGVLITSFGQRGPEEWNLDVEEGYVLVKRLPLLFFDKPPLGVKFKIGKFYTELGRLNLLHTHDLPQYDRPLVWQELLTDERGMFAESHSATGVSAQFFAPFLPQLGGAWTMTLQGVSQSQTRLTSDGGTAAIANLRWNRTVRDAHHFEFAGVWHTQRAPQKGRVHLFSLDALYRWRPTAGGQWRGFLLGGQMFWLRPEGGRPRPAWYTFGQYQFDREWFLGVRGDWTSTAGAIGSRRFAAGPYVSYYPSEFLRFRLGYQRQWARHFRELDPNHVLYLEVNFVFGSHPPEPYWSTR